MKMMDIFREANNCFRSSFAGKLSCFPGNILGNSTRRKFGDEYEARRSMASQQENPAAQGDQAQIPVFICSLAMPGVKCPLHIFEPRYRDEFYYLK